eukprot:COSAG01_NODE_5823_length_4011_cov_3.745399_4_plen_257_part_00
MQCNMQAKVSRTAARANHYLFLQPLPAHPGSRWGLKRGDAAAGQARRGGGSSRGATGGGGEGAPAGWRGRAEGPHHRARTLCARRRHRLFCRRRRTRWGRGRRSPAAGGELRVASSSTVRLRAGVSTMAGGRHVRDGRGGGAASCGAEQWCASPGSGGGESAQFTATEGRTSLQRRRWRIPGLAHQLWCDRGPAAAGLRDGALRQVCRGECAKTLAKRSWAGRVVADVGLVVARRCLRQASTSASPACTASRTCTR